MEGAVSRHQEQDYRKSERVKTKCW